MPEISVIMGVYIPGEDTQELQASIRSVQEQTFTDWEFLICDDGSSPAVQGTLDQLALEDPRIRLCRGGGACALPQKLNLCLANAKGTYIARMDGDDRSAPQRFQKQRDFLESHPEAAFVGCDVTVFYQDRVVGERLFPQAPTPMDFRFNMPFVHPTLMFRREALLAVRGYSQSKWVVLCEDYDLLLRLYAKGYQGYNLKEKLFFYQVGPQDDLKRRFPHRINESVTRFFRFRQLGMLPKALPYVIKPLAVGLLPRPLLRRLKEERNGWKNS